MAGLSGTRSFRGGTLVALFLAAVLALGGCTTSADGGRWRPIVPLQDRARANPAAAPATQATPAASGGPAAASATVAAPVVVAGPEEAEGAIRLVVERGNEQQVQAIATRDPALMASTATTRYHQETVQLNQQLLDNGVVAIKLLKLDWGPIEVQGNTATATTWETWRTIWADGAVDEARDRNVYTLVRQGGEWRVDADDHPDDQPAAGRGGPPPRGTPEPRAPEPDLPRDPGTSTNWSGYAAGGGTYTSVTGTWTVPQAPHDGQFGASAAWVGIGGLRTRDLIQAGTQQVVSGTGRVSYQAWIELLPAPSQRVPLAVAPDDSVTVTITNTSGNTWQIAMANNSTGQTLERTVEYASCRCSAEWIQEAPSIGRRGVVPINEFEPVQFTNGSAVRDGKTVTIAQTGARAISLAGSGRQILAKPSPLGPDGASFTVEYTGPSGA